MKQLNLRNGLCAATAAAALLAGPSVAMANNTFHGVYLGGQIGWASYDVKTDNSLGEPRFDGISASGVSSGLILGTGTVNDGWYFGFQANYLTNTADASVRRDGIDDDADVEQSYGIDARLGRVVADNVLLYGLAGWQRTNIELEVSQEGGSFKDDEDFDAFRFGAGVEFATDDNVFFRMEYTYSVYSSEDFNVRDEAGVVDQDIELDPEAQAFHFSLGYRF